MWMMLIFDLPVVEYEERRSYQLFREYLLDQGFEMAQYSVYLRHCSGKEQYDALAKRIQINLPPAGKVYLLSFTDKQYENMIRFLSQELQPRQKNPEQLLLL